MEKNNTILSEKEKKNINAIIKRIIKSHSMKPSTLTEMVASIEENGLKIVYDRFSLFIYEHNFNAQQINYFYTTLKTHVMNEMNKETLKARKEFASLVEFFIHDENLKINLDKATIYKSEHPDFEIIDNNYKHGIELVRLTTEYDQVFNNITDMISDSLNIEEAKNKAMKKHGEKATKYKYISIASKPVIMTCDMTPFRVKRLGFAKQVYEKYIKFKNQISNFHTFTILCDAVEEFAISCLDDVREVFDFIKSFEFEKQFCVAVMFRNKMNAVEVYEETIL